MPVYNGFLIAMFDYRCQALASAHRLKHEELKKALAGWAVLVVKCTFFTDEKVIVGETQTFFL